MEERRKYTRINDSLSLDHRPAKSLFLSSSLLENLSAGGVCFPTLQRLEPPQQIGLDIHVPEFKEPVSVFAEVVWLKEIEDINYRYHIGAKFLKMSPAHRVWLFHHLRNKIQEPDPQ